MADQFAIYVHWPYCLAKCPYCDFNSHVRKSPLDQTQFVKAYLAELQWFYDQTGPRTVDTIFFGGGTPSLMQPQIVADIIETIDELWGIADAAEISLEANPTSIEAQNFKGYRLAGVNRLSVGIQAMNEKDLKRLGRKHTVDEALAAYKLATKIFNRTSFDLIYARPQQTLDQWRDELSKALQYAQGHMSLYQLTIEPQTAFFDLHQSGRLTIPQDDLALAMYELTAEMTDKAGLPAYEISNHASPGNECRHNLLYWRYGEYAGIGPGAHSRVVFGDGKKRAIANIRNPDKWYTEAESTRKIEILSDADQASELVLMGLRLKEGIADKWLPADRVEQLVSQDLLRHEHRTVRVSGNGRKVLNAVVDYLLR